MEPAKWWDEDLDLRGLSSINGLFNFHTSFRYPRVLGEDTWNEPWNGPWNKTTPIDPSTKIEYGLLPDLIDDNTPASSESASSTFSTLDSGCSSFEYSETPWDLPEDLHPTLEIDLDDFPSVPLEPLDCEGPAPTSKRSTRSKRFFCTVASCRYAASNLLSPGFSVAKRKHHYESMHPELLLRCKYDNCKSQGFFRPSDLKGHISRCHPSGSASKETGPMLELNPGDEGRNGSLELKDEGGKPTQEDVASAPSSCASSPSQEPVSSTSDSTPNTESPFTTSDGFETDSAWSDSEPDCIDGSDLRGYESYEHFSIENPEIMAQIVQSPGSVLRPAIDPIRQRVVDSIMKEFWVIFNQEWSANIKRRSGNSPPDSTSPSAAEEKGSPGKSSSKRKRDRDEGDQERLPDDNDEKESKRQKLASPAERDEGSQFACPYRKHDPRKYCHLVRKWRPCALTPLKDISRVKGHLYRYHRIFQCQRCKELFEGEKELDSHIVEVEGCAVIELTEPAEGILANGSLEKKLRSRKKTHPGQTEVERWQEMYKTLFPTAKVPSPHFEVVPTTDDIIRSPDSEELANYEAYSRTELPRVFRDALQEAISHEAQPIEERMRSQLVSMIRDCQDRVFSAYRDRRSGETPNSSQNSSLPFTSSFQTESSPARVPESDPIDRLETLYRGPPHQVGYQTIEAVLSMAASATVDPNVGSDSGYASEMSGGNLDGLKEKASTENIRDDSQLQSAVYSPDFQSSRPDSSPQSILLAKDSDQNMSTFGCEDIGSQILPLDGIYDYHSDYSQFLHGSDSFPDPWPGLGDGKFQPDTQGYDCTI
ncbi:hypothetical protein PVAG01_00814 [Phlyctema vagabunda]|uniref:C2H2-type domain-containing protein n=1 Tax=Phlyctema vagabunda TaxID=108571 RepID=A0ABR4PVD1_9HELO